MEREPPGVVAPALDSGRSKASVTKTGQPGFFFPPVGGGWGPTSPKFRISPECSAISAPESVEGPASGARPPAGRGRGTPTQAPGAVTGQEQEGVGPDRPLDGEHCGAWVPALFFADAQAGFHLAMSDFNFPPLPDPTQQGIDRERQLPATLLLDSRDQEERRLAMFVVVAGFRQ